MLWVVILHEPVVCGIFFCDKGDQCLVEDVCEQEAIHYPLEDANASPSLLAYSSPDVDFHRMFSSVWYKS